jgi:hypothetical protein
MKTEGMATGRGIGSSGVQELQEITECENEYFNLWLVVSCRQHLTENPPGFCSITHKLSNIREEEVGTGTKVKEVQFYFTFVHASAVRTR